MCLKIRPSLACCEALRSPAFSAETAALTYQRHGMRRVKDEKSGAWHDLASFFSLSLSLSLDFPSGTKKSSAFAATVNSRL